MLHVITDTDRRGAQVFALDLQDALRRQGHESDTLAMATGENVPGLDVAVLGPSRYSLPTLRNLRKRMADVDVTVGHGSDTLLACAVAGFGRRRPFVYRQISDTRFWTATWARRLRVAVMLRLARHVVALSSNDRDDVVEHLWFPAERVTVIPNGVPIDGFAPPTTAQRMTARKDLAVPDDAFVVLDIGALVPEKGVDVAIRSVQSLENVHLLIVGDGPERASLELLAGELAPGRVTFAGSLDEPISAYHAADVCVLPSLGGDTMPATLIEAGLCGLPCVATPIGAIEEVVLHDRTGLIVPAGDDDALTTAVGGLVADPTDRQRLGNGAQEHCSGTFAIDRVAGQWAQVLAPADSAAVVGRPS